MKKYILILISIITLFSCDDLIDCPPEFQLVEGNNITDEASALSILNGGYAQLIKQGKTSWDCHNYFDYRYYSTTASLLGLWDGESLLRSDNDLRSYNFQNIYNSSLASNVFDQLLLKTCAISSNANTVIKYLPNLADHMFTKNKKEHILGEAYFLRAFSFLYYFRYSGYVHDINSEYGGIYWEDHPAADNLYVKRFTVRETYEKLLSDLSKAIDAKIPFKNPFRASSILAKMYKAEVLLMRGEPGDVQEALKLCNEIIDSDERELEKTYLDIYKNKYQSKELMFSRSYSKSNIEYIKIPASSKYYLYNQFGKTTVFKASQAYKTICNNDNRFSALVKDMEIKKRKISIFTNCYDSNNDNIPMYYARKAQAYIMKAEALFRSGADVKEIYDVIDVLRDRGGCEKVNRLNDYDENYLSDLIFTEAIKELNFESPYSYNLSLRLKYNTNEIIKKYNKQAKYKPLYTFIFAISPYEMKLNENIYQNPAYKHLN